jgi:hypothetical protein
VVRRYPGDQALSILVKSLNLSLQLFCTGEYLRRIRLKNRLGMLVVIEQGIDKEWEALPFTVCPLHRAILIDSCPHCHQSLSWRRKKVSVCSCGYDWRRISPAVIEGDGELTAVRRMLSIWLENAPGHFPLGDSPLTREVSTVYVDALCAMSEAWLFLKNEVRLQATTENWLCHCAVTSVASALATSP